jgi:hypothetical protein
MADKHEYQNQLQWFKDLLEVLEAGHLDVGILTVKAAIGLLERSQKPIVEDKNGKVLIFPAPEGK